MVQSGVVCNASVSTNPLIIISWRCLNSCRSDETTKRTIASYPLRSKRGLELYELYEDALPLIMQGSCDIPAISLYLHAHRFNQCLNLNPIASMPLPTRLASVRKMELIKTKFAGMIASTEGNSGYVIDRWWADFCPL